MVVILERGISVENNSGRSEDQVRPSRLINRIIADAHVGQRQSVGYNVHVDNDAVQPVYMDTPTWQDGREILHTDLPFHSETWQDKT